MRVPKECRETLVMEAITRRFVDEGKTTNLPQLASAMHVSEPTARVWLQSVTPWRLWCSPRRPTLRGSRNEYTPSRKHLAELLREK